MYSKPYGPISPYTPFGYNGGTGLRTTLLTPFGGTYAVMGVWVVSSTGFASLPFGLLTIFLPPSGVRLQGDGNAGRGVKG